jgi:SRSO17 transposase
LSDYYVGFAPLFLRSEQREWAQLYLRGQLSELQRKSIEPMVLRERGKDINAVRAVQQFIGEGAWDDDRILARDRQLVAEELGEADAPAGLRWPVETAIEEGKSEPGMEHYETRTWRGWHHHMTLTFLAHHFLVRLRLKLKKSLRR